MTKSNAILVDHPLIKHKLSIMRDLTTPTSKFRQLLREISLLLAYEVCRDLETELVDIRTPLETMSAPKLEGKKLCFISILRAWGIWGESRSAAASSLAAVSASTFRSSAHSSSWSFSTAMRKTACAYRLAETALGIGVPNSA